MRTHIKSLIFILLGYIMFPSCEKDNTPDSNYQNENLSLAEEAFPNRSGELISLQFKGERITCELIDGKYVFQGDLIINPENETSLKGSGLDLQSTRWPYGWVYYTIAEDIPDQERITDAMKEWENKTDIQFYERTNEENYIHFIKADGCWSYVGMQGNKQEIGIGNWGKTGNMVHEIGHALGLIHEHSRFNRDDFIIVNWDNILPDKSNNFEIYNTGIATQILDFNSIMMYPSHAFQKAANSPTLVKLDGSTFSAQRDSLSTLDTDIISWIYNEIHDPVIEDLFTDEDKNVGIASDGDYYYTCSMNHSTIRKMSKDGTINYGKYSLPLGNPRGLAYNKSDGMLYVSSYGGDILRITDLENGQVETVYSGLMQNSEASFALSEDGTKLFDFYKGTLKVYNFKTGELAYTLHGLKYGEYPYNSDEYSDAYYGAASVAVDASYIYTWDSWKNEVYVYNHLGEFIRQMELESGINGMSLSVFDGYLFVAYDDIYDPGTWYKYNIRNPLQ